MSNHRNTAIQPVIFGGDAGAYALGLECYEAFGATSICVAAAPVVLISRSRFFEVHPITASASDEERIAVLDEIARSHPEKTLLLLANTDGLIDFFARHRDHLSRRYVIPFPDEETIELLGRKDSFAAICAQEGALTPPTVVVDLEDCESQGWAAPSVPFRFPVVAKAAAGKAYDAVQFEGKRKIWYMDSQEELDHLWPVLCSAGYRDRFLVQELIPGDDTCMRSLTFYVGSDGRVLLRAAAQVLLQDPAPTMIGNPVAMITEPLPQLWEAAERILKAGNYRGFANFDIKIDPRDGTAYFFEVNPRIGRNSYYVVAAGVNPMTVMVDDLVEGAPVTPVTASKSALYTLVPVSLIKRYVKDPVLRSRVAELVHRRRVVNPLESPVEGDAKRRVIALAQKYNYFRKFKAHFKVQG